MAEQENVNLTEDGERALMALSNGDMRKVRAVTIQMLVIFGIQMLQIHWGSEIRPFKIRKHLKSRLFEGQISNGQVFKWCGFRYGYRYSPNHLKTGPLKIRMILSRFQMYIPNPD